MQTVILNPLDSDHPAVLDGLTSFGEDIFGTPPNLFDSGSVVLKLTLTSRWPKYKQFKCNLTLYHPVTAMELIIILVYAL